MMKSLLLLALLSLGYAGDTTTFLSFSRRIQTCDTNDRPLEEATSKMIWSYNSQDPVSDNQILQHEERGVKSVRFFNEDSAPNLPPDAQATDLVLNNQPISFDMPGAGGTTQYWCSAYKLSGVFATKRQVIRVEPVIDPRNFANVHHILIYLCPFLNETDLAWQGGCYQPNTPSNIRKCNGPAMVTGWAVGGFPQNFPDNIGYPFEGQDIYMIMETHYDNPKSLTIAADSSGMRMWHTGVWREFDAGTFVVGMITDEDFKIPAGQTNFPYHAYCPEECTRTHVPPEGFYIIGVTLHTHLAGRQAYFRHFRNGTELAPILAEPYYDFNYQDTTTLPQARLVLPGDSFQVDCIYDTSTRTTETQFGLSTQEEMCLAFATYYPKLPSNAEHCLFGNYTGVGYFSNATVVCGEITIPFWDGPPAYEPYQAPPCVYSPPPTNNTLPQLVDRLDYSRYERNFTLDEDGNYKLYWTVDRENLLFHAAVEVKTEGWVGLGISPNGMEGADVLIGWVKDGQVHFGDRFATMKAQPPLDALQDFYDIQAGQYTTTTEPLLTTKQIVGIAVGGGLLGLALLVLVIFQCSKRKKNSELDTVLTTDTYGGTRDRDDENLDPPSMNQKSKEAVAL